MVRLIVCLVFVGVMVANVILALHIQGRPFDFGPWITVGFAGGLLVWALTEKK